MTASKLVLLAAAALVLSACAEDSDTARSGDSRPPTSGAKTTPEPRSEPTRTIPPLEEAPPDGDVAPGPDGVVPPEIVPFGSAAYRSTTVEGEFEPFQWAPMLVAVECGSIDPQSLIETYRDDLVDPLILRPGEELCTATLRYENIGSVPGIPAPPSGVIVENALYGDGDPAVMTINDTLISQSLDGHLQPGQVIEIDTHLIAPAGAEIDAVHFGPDASLIEVWLTTG